MAKRSPHELLLLVAAAIIGVSYTLGAPPPTSISATQPAWAVRAWAVAMLISGVAGLVGNMLHRDPMRSLRLTGGAMDLGAAAMVLYTVSLFAYAGGRAIAAGVTFGLWAAANLWRAHQLRRELRELDRYLREVAP